MSYQPPNPQEIESETTERGGKWGWTVGLDVQGDLRRNALHQYAPIYDEQAVIQSLKVALLTPQGFDPLRPEYGLDHSRAFGEKDPVLKMAIRDAIGPDAAGIERVQQINAIRIDRQGRDRENVTLHITVTLREGGVQSFPFALNASNYPTAGGRVDQLPWRSPEE